MKEIKTLGVDLGGTKIETALIDGQGRVLSSHREPTHPDRGPKRIIEDILNSRALEAASEGLMIVRAALGTQAGTIGAAALARERT